MSRKLTIAALLAILIPFCSTDTFAARACFRGNPLPHCRTFWITESGALYRFDLPETNDKWYATLMYNWELGLMSNQSEKYAIGASLFLDFDDFANNFQFGFRPRYRRWLSSKVSLDIAPGIILKGSKIEKFAFSGEAFLGYDDHIAAVIRLDIMQASFAHQENFAWYGGLRFRSYPGLVAGIVGPIILLAIYMDSSHFADFSGLKGH